MTGNRKAVTIISSLAAAVVFVMATLVLFRWLFTDPNFAETVVSIGLVISATVVTYRISTEEILRRNRKE